MLASFDIAGAIGLVATIFGLLGLLTAATVIVRSKALVTAAETWKKVAEAKTAQVDELVHELTQAKADVKAARDAMQQFADVMSGREEVRELRRHQDQQHNALLAALRDVRGAMERLAAAIRASGRIGEL